MICPICKTVVMKAENLDSALISKACDKCGGRWIPSFYYWQWLNRHGDRLPEKPVENMVSLPVEDSGAGKLCPECGHFLAHKKVGHGIEFCLDRCMKCGGFWLDKNEWEILLSRNLHDELHLIFSLPWQQEVREEEADHDYQNRIEKILGSNDYARIHDISGWINSHPHRSTILRYILEGKV